MTGQAAVESLGYGPIVFVLLLVLGMALAILAASHLPLKWQRHGRVKDTIYESGMPPIGDARRRFNVRFYLVAMLFLLFDVELIFMCPWALVFFRAAKGGGTSEATASLLGGASLPGFLFVEMAIFMAILLVGYVYAWRKGIFRWE